MRNKIRYIIFVLILAILLSILVIWEKFSNETGFDMGGPAPMLRYNNQYAPVDLDTSYNRLLSEWKKENYLWEKLIADPDLNSHQAQHLFDSVTSNASFSLTQRAKIYLALYHYRMGDQREACNKLSVLSEKADSVSYMILESACLLESNKYDSAKLNLEKLCMHSVEYGVFLANYYELMGEVDQAVKIYQRIIDEKGYKFGVSQRISELQKKSPVLFERFHIDPMWLERPKLKIPQPN